MAGPGLKMYFPLKMGDSPACYVRFPEGTFFLNFHPDPWGGDGIQLDLRIFFQMGLFNHHKTYIDVLK